MKHPIKMSRIKHILAITLSLLLIAIIADAQVSQRRRAQPPQPQQQRTQPQKADEAQYEPGHICSRDCFTTTFTENNTRFKLERSNKCNEAIVLGYILKNKKTKSKRQNKNYIFLRIKELYPFPQKTDMTT